MVCETTSSLPNPGGLFQQETKHVWKLEKVFQARNRRQQDKAEEKK